MISRKIVLRECKGRSKAKRKVLPPAIRRKIVDLKAEQNQEEIANVCRILFGRRPDGEAHAPVLFGDERPEVAGLGHRCDELLGTFTPGVEAAPVFVRELSADLPHPLLKLL
jgi:hypothetical protein